MKKLRKNLRLVTVFLIALFVLLAGYGAYSVAVYGNRWFSSSANTFARTQKKNVIPGNIEDRNGIVLASADNGKRVYLGDAGARRATVHAVGDSGSNVNNSAESFFASYLYGFSMSFTERLGYALRGEEKRGDTVRLTIDSRLAQYVSTLFPEGRAGAVVVMNYKTGEVLTEQSFPSFDPQNIDASVKADPLKPFFNRAIQGLYTPGSTFKIVTAASVIENMPSYDTLTVTCDGMLQLGQRLVTDAGTDMAAGKVTKHGELTLKQAFTVSCNNAFARLALQLGDLKLRKTAERFGFNDNFLFQDMVVENSSYPAQNRTDGEIAWTGAGQSALSASPLHLCMIAACVANDGVMMEPRMLLSAVSPAGYTRASLSSRVYRRALSAQQAAVLKGYMRAVITSGTGAAANIPGVKVCGKTGSAEIDSQENTNAFFAGFLDDPDAPYALAIAVEDAGSGGSVAAPMAKQIFSWMLEKTNRN